MKKGSLLGFSLLLAFGLANVPAILNAAENTDRITNTDTQCASLIRECFAYESIQRTSCFYSTATHPFCDGSELGALSYRRWILTPAGSQGVAAPGLGGPQLINRECLASFDQKFQAEMAKPTVADDTIHQLTASLEECKRDMGVELQRP